MDTISIIGKQILRPSYLKIRLTGSLDHIQKNILHLVERLSVQFRHFMVVYIHL
jgi:hypothetical protein